MYMESISDGKRFVQVASEVTKRKPVIALKVGRFESGQKAAASHTGALAASDTAFDAAFAKAGVLRADTAEQLFDWARVLENCPLPKSHWLSSPGQVGAYRNHAATTKIGILTNAGGPGVIAADSLEHHGLALAQLGESTRKELSAILPPAASVHNPVDMLASASPEQYASCLKSMLKDEAVDAVMVILPPPPMFKAEEVAEKLVAIMESSGLPLVDSKLSDSTKPVVIALLGSTLIEEAGKVFQRANVPTYPFPERAASALSALFKHGVQSLQTLQADSKIPKVRRLLSPDSPDELLTSYGIPTSPIKLAHDANEAVTIANELGFPVVMKIASPDILHKSDIGGVLLNIKSAEDVSSGYTLLLERAKNAKPDAKIDGVHIQRQIPEGQEVIVGMVRDPQFGALMMFGSGGVEVEGLKDVAFCLAPLDQAEAEEMMRRTWAGRKLKGFRNIPPVDQDSVTDVLIKLSRLVIEHEEIKEIEINPLRVLAKGAVAVDVRIKTNSNAGDGVGSKQGE
jgi:acetyltransferase